jgi:metallo-beta-lactamase family protein
LQQLRIKPFAHVNFPLMRYNAFMKTFSTTSTKEPTVTFFGAAQSVTGSMHLVEFGPTRILLDCGRVIARRGEAQRHHEFPFHPATIDAVLLSHAHVDHCGNLPNLVGQGFRGPIYCTSATRDLVNIMLVDSARIHEQDAAIAGVVAGAAAEPAYTRSDAARAIEQCVPVGYDQTFHPAADCQARFTDAGHILGSAMVCLAFSRGNRVYHLTFTGDLGRRGLPFVREPALVAPGDLVLCESTYGGRVHDTREAMAAKMADVVSRTFARGGRVLIPAFSLGRTQVVLHYLRRWMRDDVLPTLPLFVDSPLAGQISGVYDKHRNLLSAASTDEGPEVHYVATYEEHRELAARTGTCVVVASGGMCQGGRIMQHLKHHLDDPRDSVVLVSYQAPHSLGAQLLERRPIVRFHGRSWNKWAEVVQINGFSGHADHNDFLALLGPAAKNTGRVRLVHGEPEQAEALAAALSIHGFADVAAAQRGETVSVP